MAGTDQSVTTEEYADLVAEQVRRHVRNALLLHGDGTVADPVVLGEAMDDLSVYVPEESPNELATLLAPFWSGAKGARCWAWPRAKPSPNDASTGRCSG